jgi:hypothetical protein
MSRRSDEAAPADARPKSLSRRLIIAGAAAAPLLAIPRPATAVAATDEAVSACEDWLTREAEYDQLADRWMTLETILVRQHNWFALTGRQQRRHPIGWELFDLNKRMRVLIKQNHALLPVLPTIAATTPQGLIRKLAVAEREVRPDENKPVHDLIASIGRDFTAVIAASRGA